MRRGETMITFEYPLKWLPQQKRTASAKRARFETSSISRAGDYLADELRRLGAKNCVITTNLQTRQRGDGFYANQRVDDAGVVVYFELRGKGKAMACDRWDRPEHNLWALYLSVQAIRGLERWGGSELLDGLFTGFKALPSPDDVIITTIDYFQGCHTDEERKIRHRKLAKELHPDVGGSLEEFQDMERQYNQFIGRGD